MDDWRDEGTSIDEGLKGRTVQTDTTHATAAKSADDARSDRE